MLLYFDAFFLRLGMSLCGPKDGNDVREGIFVTKVKNESPAIGQSQTNYIKSISKSGFEMWFVLVPAPWVLGTEHVSIRTRL